MRRSVLLTKRVKREVIWAAGLLMGVATVAVATLPSTSLDFFFGGTQPLVIQDDIATAMECAQCHGGFDIKTEPFRPWAASMMGQSIRDPVFKAALTVANQDAAFAGDMCLRCHAPGAWVGGRSEPPDGSGFTYLSDSEGVTCNFCHRMVDPVSRPENPVPDQDILAALPTPPGEPNSANFVVDPYDRRRGPLDLGPQFFFHDWLQSPFHTRSNMCATCHDISNPLYTRQPNGSYALNAFDAPHPDGDKTHMFPMERTFGEWSQSSFAAGPVDVGGRFGGTLAAVSSCQDCHMPQTSGQVCQYVDPRPEIPTHYFNGGNTWVLRAVRNLFPDSATNLSDQSVDESITRAKDMLAKASDMELTFLTSGAKKQLNVRIINRGGHKLPTGYSEGRRMWINVVFTAANGKKISEFGHYDAASAVLDQSSTKVYEAVMGVDAAVSAATGVPAGPSFHFALNNTWVKDNRIPPLGFTNAGFAAVQAQPVGATYADGQNWDDTSFTIPAGAAVAKVSVFFQTSSKEYMEFLRDENTTNTLGQVAYDQWVLTGKSDPTLMDQQTIAMPCYANCDGSVVPPVLNANDFNCFLNQYAAGDPRANCDGSTSIPVLNANDFNCFLNKFASGCP